MPNKPSSRFTVQPVNLLDNAQKIGNEKKQDVVITVDPEGVNCKPISGILSEQELISGYAQMHEHTNFEIFVFVAFLIFMLLIVLGYRLF